MIIQVKNTGFRDYKVFFSILINPANPDNPDNPANPDNPVYYLGGLPLSTIFFLFPSLA